MNKDNIEGKMYVLAGKIQQKYGGLKEDIQHDLEHLWDGRAQRSPGRHRAPRPRIDAEPQRRTMMASLFWTITVVLLVLWALGFAVNIGSSVNILLMVALIMVLFNIISWAGHRRVP